MNAKKCVLSNENLNGDEFVKVKYAREYLIKLGYWVSPSPYNKPVLILFLIMMFPLVSAVNFGIDNPDLPHLNGIDGNLTIINQTINQTYYTNVSGGNPFDQWLNTTSNVTFAGLSSAETIIRTSDVNTRSLRVTGLAGMSVAVVEFFSSGGQSIFDVNDAGAFQVCRRLGNESCAFIFRGRTDSDSVVDGQLSWFADNQTFNFHNPVLIDSGMNISSDVYCQSSGICYNLTDVNSSIGVSSPSFWGSNGTVIYNDTVDFVGIGNATPINYDGLFSKFMVRSNSGTHGGLVFESDADRVSNIVFANDGDSKWHISSRHEAQGNQLRFFQSNGSGTANPVIAFTQDHRIGFGTNAPDFKFEVKDTDSSNTFGSAILINGSLGSPTTRASLIIFNSGGTVAGRGNGVFFGNNNETHGGTFFVGQPRSWSAPYSDLFSIGYNNATVGGINSGAASDLAFTMTGNGRVGINTIARGINLLDLDPVDQHAGLHIQPSSASGPTYYIDVEDQFGTKIFTVEPDGTVAFNNFEVPNNNAAQSFLGGFVAFTDAQTTIQNNINVPGRIPLAMLDLKNSTNPTIVFATHTDPFPNRERTSYIDSNWSNATQGAHRGDLIFGVSDFNANREALRLSANGTHANANFSTDVLNVHGDLVVNGNVNVTGCIQFNNTGIPVVLGDCV